MESRENGIADDDLYGQAVYAIDAEIGPNGRHGYLNLNPPFCSLKTQIGPKLLGDEIERLKGELGDAKDALDSQGDTISGLGRGIDRGIEEARFLREALKAKDEGYSLIIKDLKEKLEKAEEEGRKLNWEKRNEHNWAALSRDNLLKLDDFVSAFCTKFQEGDY